MPRFIAHLGPAGTYAEAVAIAWAHHLNTQGSAQGQEPWQLQPYSSIAKTLNAVATGQVPMAVVPVENSIEGSVTMTLDTLWQLDALQVQQALVLPISHALISQAPSLAAIEYVYSHPQALAQCQGWIEQHLPTAKPIATNSTVEALQHLDPHAPTAAIASQRAADLYQLPILAHPINDRPDNCTRFWVMSLAPSTQGTHLSMAFSLPRNTPGALVSALQIFGDRQLNMSRIESRPTKRSLGEYLFFVDLEIGNDPALVHCALEELQAYTETLKIFGRYCVAAVDELPTQATPAECSAEESHGGGQP
jgi:prephenate dehydratase